MILDAVLGDRCYWWLSPEDDKRRFFGLMRDNWLRPEDYPHIAFGSGRQQTIRCFPDKLPIDVEKDSTSHLVFLYLVNRCVPVDFRQCLIRHAELFRYLHTWTIRLLVPRRFRKSVALYKAAVREELWMPMNPSVSKALETYFPERQAQCGHLGEGILAFAERILPRASDLWVQASLDYRQRLQELFFPDGIAYDGNRFNRTAATAPLFNYLAPTEGADEKVVSRGGIEPPTRRLRERVAPIRSRPYRVFPSILRSNVCCFVRRFPLAAARWCVR